ncbi:hypothetical protein [Salinarimonas soli]|uniref:EF-hand domain-containing protein n=1 Tax=Salinarimonas soli TaxID=1638099 RepID=A0A5B2VG07_9HYPH|nr:hypothetical protein [Salinarimonas soli]KAA2237249.1 hypothetical protein F0L46_09565 [Salinarimonas soli]
MSKDGLSYDRGLASFGSLVDLAARHAGEDGVLDAGEFKAFAKAAKLKGADLSMVDGADGSAKDGKVSMGELVARMGIADHADGVRGDNGLLSRKEVRGITRGCIGNAPLPNAAIGEVDAPGTAPTGDSLLDAMDGPSRRHSGAVTAGELFDFLVAAKDRNGRHLHGGDYRFNGDELKALAKATGLDEGKLAALAGSDGYLDIADLQRAVESGDTDGSGALSGDELADLLLPAADDEEPCCGPTCGAEATNPLFAAIDGSNPAHLGALTTGEVFDFLIQARGADGAPLHGGDDRFDGDEVAALAAATGFAASALARMAGADGILDATDIADAVAAADTSRDGTLDRGEFDGLSKAT